MIRFFDILFSLLGLILLSPFFLALSFLIAFDSSGGVFFKQIRVGKNSKDFILLKFRSMRTDSEQKSLLTIGNKDNRITRTGNWMRKYKLDELPQLINVLRGDMSLVGPRPEVRKYTDLYNDQQKQILLIRPGITDFASLEYFDEDRLLGESTDPETTYINEIMPAKLELNLKYINHKNSVTYLTILCKTVKRIVR